MDTGWLYQPAPGHMMYNKRLKEIGSFSLKKNKQRVDLVAVFSYLQK